ncbi:hypothetical protein [Jannaschia donghaensis]|uniref:EF hand n=1 Tax=Jannaschia donghaensis TaxID=420998 RepID=A0A0M6YFY2_9RHOB|nr:hypothetical protein [Jannaschia donghaensis]CTQ48844.1 EF hand [Jannaschia donghaensis]
MTRTFTLLAATLFAVTPVLADMEDYDGDGDAMLNDAEFGEADGGKRFMAYDSDGSGDISEAEFAAGEFSRYDRNRDGGVDAEEYGRYESDDDDGEMESESEMESEEEGEED